MMITHLANPPQADEYVPLVGQIFPEQYPFNFEFATNKYAYFFRKYYQSQSQFFAIPMRPIYANYEVLCNGFNTKIMDLSMAETYEIDTEALGQKNLEKLLDEMNLYSLEKFK